MPSQNSFAFSLNTNQDTQSPNLKIGVGTIN